MWNYMSKEITYDSSNPEELGFHLSKYGAKGWELVSVQVIVNRVVLDRDDPYKHNVLCVFKRAM